MQTSKIPGHCNFDDNDNEESSRLAKEGSATIMTDPEPAMHVWVGACLSAEGLHTMALKLILWNNAVNNDLAKSG